MTAPGLLSLLALLERRSREEAVAHVVDLYHRTGSVDEVVKLISAAQREVGRRWELNQWSVAQEHLSTAILDTALAVVAERAGGSGTHGDIVVACAEGEWHVLPARMFAEQLRLSGFGVTFLGPSMPAAHLERFLTEARPAAVCVSCSVPIFLLGALRSIDAGHAAGVPVLAGGAAFGRDDRRAMALGADAWAPDAPTAETMLAGGLARRPPISPPGLDDALRLAAIRSDLVDDAFERLQAREPSLADWTTNQLDRTREDFGYILAYAEAAILTGDRALFDDFVRWLFGVLTARGVRESLVVAGVEVLHEAARERSAVAAELLSAALERW